MQPTLAYFLRNRLNETGQSEVRRAMETAFREHYEEVGIMLSQLLESKKPQERQVGQLLTGLEYENLMTALNLALEAQVSIIEPYVALSNYLDITQDQKRGLELGQAVLNKLEAYSKEKLTTQFINDITYLLESVALQLSKLQRYAAAEAMYQKSLSLWLENKHYDPATTREKSAITYSQLGKMAYEQRNWELAEQYYHQVLQIFIDFNVRLNQAKILHLLGSVFLEQRQWQRTEEYYQQALQTYQDASERYEQARTYHQLGRVAQEQRQWQQARSYFLTALTTYVDYNDTHKGGIVLRSIARLWQASGDAGLPAAVAPILGSTVEETEALLREGLEEK